MIVVQDGTNSAQPPFTLHQHYNSWSIQSAAAAAVSHSLWIQRPLLIELLIRLHTHKISCTRYHYKGVESVNVQTTTDLNPPRSYAPTSDAFHHGTWTYLNVRHDIDAGEYFLGSTSAYLCHCNETTVLHPWTLSNPHIGLVPV